MTAAPASREETVPASSLARYDYKLLATGTASDHQLASRLLGIAANAYRNSGRSGEADKAVSLSSQVQGFASVNESSTRAGSGDKVQKDTNKV